MQATGTRRQSIGTAVVLGGGVMGLTTAIRLAESGINVRVVARDYLRGTTSWIATAIWHVFWVGLDERVERWSAESLDELLRLSSSPESGISRVRGIECVRTTSPEADLVHGGASGFWRDVVPYYLHLSREEVIARLPDDYPIETISGGYIIEVPIADMSVYLPYLLGRLEALGVNPETAEVHDIDDLRARFPADIYVNCTGLGSREFANDTELQGVKGQIVRVSKGDISEYIADDFSPRGMTYILPRTGDVILGGSAEESVEDNQVDLDFSEEIINRCSQLMPAVAGSAVLEHLAGVRPFRKSVRLERDPLHEDLVHNYGHGGSGVSLSWGCADEVVRIASE